MNKFVALTLSVVMFSSVSNAWIVQGEKWEQPRPPGYVTVEECSANLYQKLSTYESATDAACSHGRTDREFQKCTIELTKKKFRDVEVAGFFCAKNEARSQVHQCTLSLTNYFFDVARDPNFDYRSYALSLCQSSLNPSYAGCVIDLYSRGGQEINNASLQTDANRLCRNATNEELNSCIIKAYNNEGKSGSQAARICLEQHDPVAKARREAELRRIEEEKRRRAEAERRAAEQRAAEQRAAAQRVAEQRAAEQRTAEQRAAEQRRIEEQRRQEDQRRQGDQRTQEQKRQEELRRQQEEQRRKDEEARKKKEEEEKKKQQEQQQQPSNPPAPSNGGTGGGVIVDLPNFE
ncbi:hypothetical protein [Bdellovibrio bacteriovorus]|uniref:hypothetical protein n=1 Tax=Bdellovibrio TaxID=958 RepID=UPI0035A96D33